MQDHIVTFHEKLVTTKAWPLVFKAIVELQENQMLGPSYTGVSYESEGLVATVLDKPVGFIAFQQIKWNDSLDINLAYVAVAHRRNGLHSLMFEKLKEISVERKLRYIYSSTSVNNLEAQRAFAKQGRIISSYTYKYYL